MKNKKNKNKIVIYTTIIGGKDKLREPIVFSGCDYVCFTDDENLTSETWEIRKARLFSKDPRRNAKIYKILPHRYFLEYEYSLWVDGTHIPIVDVKYLIDEFLVNADIAVFVHPDRKCIYEEAKVCIDRGLDNAGKIQKQIDKYKSKGYPENNGLVACTIILRRHNDPVIIKTMKDWWKEIELHSVRDQLSFNYVAYKNKLKYAVIPGHVYNNPYFKYTPHLKSR